MLSTSNAQYSSWFNTHTWSEENCGMNRENYGLFISNYIRNQESPMVLNLNGSWGTGKSYFLKQLYTNLLVCNDTPTIYIDAWKSDFTNDPLLVIISEFLEQLELLFISKNDNLKWDRKKAKDKLMSNLWSLTKRTYNTAVDVGAVYAASKLSDYDSTGLLALTEKIKANNNETGIKGTNPFLGKSLTDDYKKQLKAIESTKELLGQYANFININSSNKIIVLVDELDRCRPTYAIEMLEVIKHFFEIENFTFVIATDTNQLSHSIKAVYGNSFDGNEYLSRFFTRRAELPKPKNS